MRVAVVVCHVVTKPEYAHGEQRWLESYMKNAAGYPHRVVVINRYADDTNGFMDILKPEYLRYDGGGWDCGAWQFAARNIETDLLVCFNSSTYITGGLWLSHFVEAVEENGDGLYGPLTSYEVFPHVRTPCMIFQPHVINDYPHQVDSRDDTYRFECLRWPDGTPTFTEWVKKKGLKTMLVTWDGAYDEPDWRKPDNIFRRGDQSNLIVWDRHAEAYSISDTEGKLRLERLANDADIEYGIDWTKFAERQNVKFIPPVQRHAYCAYHNVGNGSFWHRKERIKAFWPNYAWHRWADRRLKAVCDTRWITWMGPAASAKSTDAAVFGLEYWLQAPDRTAVIVCSTTVKMLRARIWSQVARFHQMLPKLKGAFYGDLMDSVTRVRWKPGDDVNGIFGMAVEEGSVEEVINNLVGIHTERVLLYLDEMQGIREAIMKATSNMMANPVFQMIGMGNPDSLTNPLGRESEPVDGWDSVVRGETEEWETHGGPTKGRGLCQFFSGKKSPADDSPEERKRLQWLCNREWYEGIVKAAHGNENDPAVWQFGIGWPPPIGLESTLLDDAIVVTFNCRAKAIWTHGFRQCAALDAAFGGGDKAKLTFIKYGETENEEGKKRWVIEFGEVLVVPIDSQIQRPIHYQILDYCRQECVRRKITPRDFALDASGEGGGLKAIFDKEWGVVTGIEAGGAPSELIIDDTGKTAREAYDTRASELCFNVREFALADGIRGMSDTMTFQACNRRTFYRNGKWCAEPKTGSKGRTDERGRPVRGYKQRMGHSPDDFDSGAVGVEFCRQQGVVPAVMGEAIKKEQETPYRYEDEYASENYLEFYALN